MSPRYRRKNRRYKVRITGTRLSWDKKLRLQAVGSAVLLVLLVSISFLNIFPRNRIKIYLYRTYTSAEWKKTFSPAVKKAALFSRNTADAYMGIFEGKKPSKAVSDTPAAKADKGEEPISIPEKLPVTVSIPEEPAPEEPWRMPHPGEITSFYGERIHPVSGEKSVHAGMDIAANSGDPVFAVHSGTVDRTGYDESNGNFVVLSHGEGITSVYIHLSSVAVNKGDYVAPGGKIGEAGSTGISTGPHLHFEIKENGASVDPGKYIIVQ